MPETFKFSIAAPAADEVAVDRVRCYESANGTDGWTMVSEVYINTLTPDANGVFTWVATGTDTAKFHLLVPVSADGVERAGGPILPPRPAQAHLCSVYLTVLKQDGTPAENVEVVSTLVSTPTVVNGVALSPLPIKVKTNSLGFALLQLVKGVTYSITSPSVGTEVEINTAGRDTLDIAMEV
jgi:hypothetical protein